MRREERGQDGKEKIEKNEVVVGEGGRRRRVEGGKERRRKECRERGRQKRETDVCKEKEGNVKVTWLR